MRKCWKKAIALLLVVMMVCAFAACGNDSSQSSSSSTDSSASSGAADSSSEASDAGTESNANAPGDEVDLTIVFCSDGMEYPDTDAVEQAVADIVKEKLNVNLSFKYVSFYDASTNLNLWLSSGEGCDVFEAMMNWSSFIQQGFMQDLTPYKDLMPNAIEAAGGYLDCGIVDGKLYGVPSVKDMINFDCYFFRKDILDSLNVDPSTVTSYEELGNLLRAIKAEYPELKPLTADSGGAVIYTNTTYSPDGKKLIMTNNLVSGTGVGLMNPTESSKVECLYMTDFYEDVVNMAYEWNKEGLIYFSDLSSGPEQVLAGTAAGAGGQYKPGAEVEWSANAGYEVKAVCHADPSDAARVTANMWNWSVSNSCTDVERACQLLDLLFEDKEINNLLAWGIEGQDYVMTDEENVVAYPEGVDSTNAPYYFWAKFGLPNNYLQYVMDPNPANLWTQMEEYNNAAKPSKAFGFTYSRNDDEINGKIVEINNIVTEYAPGLASGELEPSQLKEFRDKLTAAGIDDVIASVQEQLDAFIEAQ